MSTSQKPVMFSVTSLETAECHWSCLNLIFTSFISTRLSSEKCQQLLEAYQDHSTGSTINECHLLTLRQESSMILNPEVANYWRKCRFLVQAMSTQQFKQPKQHFNHGARYVQLDHGSYEWIIMLKKCGHLDLAVFHLIWVHNWHLWQLKKSKSWELPAK